MKKTSLWAVLASCAIAGSAMAGEGSKCGSKTVAEKAKCTKTAELASGSGCSKSKVNEAVEAVMASMPAMKYKVGDTVTPCEKTAITATGGDETKLQYVVGERSFGCRVEALSALAAAMDAEVEKLKAVSFVVDGKSIHCPMTAQALAAKGGKMSFRLAGVEFTSAEDATTAKTRIEAALVARKSGCCKGKAELASAEAKKGCCKDKAAQTVAAEAKSGCGEKAKAELASAEAKKGCCKGKAAQTVAAEAKSGCGEKAKAELASAEAKKGCCKDKAAQTVAAEAKSGCGEKAKAELTSADAKKGCCTSGAVTTVAAGNAAGCCNFEEIENRIADIREQVRVIVETAVTVNS